MDKTTRKEPIRLSEMNFTPIFIAIAVVLLSISKLHKNNLFNFINKFFFSYNLSY